MYSLLGDQELSAIRPTRQSPYVMRAVPRQGGQSPAPNGWGGQRMEIVPVREDFLEEAEGDMGYEFRERKSQRWEASSWGPGRLS